MYTNQVSENFIQSINDQSYSFIKKITLNQNDLESLDAIDNIIGTPIVNYNNAIESLKTFLTNPDNGSKTQKIIAIYNTLKEAQDNLKEIYKQSYKLSKIHEENRALKEILLNIKNQSEEALKTSKYFAKWAESIIPSSSFKDKPSIISRKFDNNEDPKKQAMSYVNSSEYENTPESDKQRVIDGKGISLSLRLKREQLDPKHRAWGTLMPSIAHSLKNVNDPWAESEPNEDLTVRIEFDDALRARDRSFNPDTHANQQQADARDANAEHPQWFNSFNKYFTKRETLDYLVKINTNKQLCNASSNLPLHTDNTYYIFVMDMDGNLFINKDGDYKDGKRIGHPSFTGGKKIASAGELKIENGKVTHINNTSGHYKPGGYSLHRVVLELEQRGVLAGNCQVQIWGDDSDAFVHNNTTRLSVDIFKQKYQDNFAQAVGNPPNLSEKANPRQLMNTLSKINQYLSKRAGETSGFLSSFFDSYTGKDYYERRNSFAFLLNKMLESNDINSIIQLIDHEIRHFNKGLRKNYHDLLIELKNSFVQCQNYPDSVLANGLVKKTISDYTNIYKTMNDYTQQSINYKKQYGHFANNQTLYANVAEAKTDYKFLRNNLNKEIKSEFSKSDTFYKQEYKNICKF